MTALQIESTPNPHSRKITHPEVRFGSEQHSFTSQEEARGHPLGEALFGIDGIDNVLILPHFITVTKDPTSSWDRILPDVKEIISQHVNGDSG